MERKANRQQAPATDRALTWEIDPNGSTLDITVNDRENDVINVRFNRINGVLVYNQDRPSLAEVWVEIDAASIESGNQQRNEHLRSGDFLAVEDHPSIYFASREVRALGQDQYQVTGNLRVRDVIVSVELQVTLERIVEAADGRLLAEFRGKGSLRRSDFDLVWDRQSRATSQIAADQLSIALQIRAIHAD